MQTLFAIAAIGIIVVLLVRLSRGAGADATIAITLILWMLMVGTAIWTAALVAAKRVMIMRLPPGELENALAAVDAVSVPTIPMALLAAAAFLAGGMTLLPILLSDWFKPRRPKDGLAGRKRKRDN